MDSEGVAPVEVITREQIQRTGQPTIAEVLRNIPANSGGSFGESFSNSFAPGAAGISLRGLGQKATLVLLNGRRVAGYGFAQNLADTFVDLNAIPASAVERVEVLMDGASAIYGSDAIAGVVNIILRKDYNGLEASGGAGHFEGKSDYRFNLTGGVGELGSDKYNFFGTLDYYKRDLLMLSDTEFGKTRDFRGHAGGRNFTSLTGGGTWRQFNGNTATNNFQAISGCKGTVMTGPQAVEAGLINPVGATNLAMASASNSFCTRDFNSEFTALPATERLGFLGRGTYEISATASAYAEVGLSHNTTFQKFQEGSFVSTGLQPTAVGLRPFAFNINFAPGVAGNPFATNARYVGTLNDIGTRDTDIKSDTGRFLLGMKYTLGSWDFDSAVGYSKNKVESSFTNRLSLSGVAAAFGVPTTAQPPVPTSTASSYNLDNPSLNNAAIRDQMRANFPRKSTSELAFVDTKASAELSQLQLPGGAVGVAVGAEFRNEKLKDSPDARAQSGDILGQGITATDGKRTSSSLYTEFALPVTKTLEGQLAARYDHYSDYGNSTTPKAGLKWKPNDVILMRANVGKGFRAPTLPEISPSAATSFVNVTDPLNNNIVQVSSLSLGNPALKAEKSTSKNLGLVVEPNKNFSLGVDLYWIEWRDIVVRPSTQATVNGCQPPAKTDTCAFVIRDPSLPGSPLVSVIRQYKNVAITRTNGADLDARLAFPTADLGKFTVRTNMSYITNFWEDGVQSAGNNGGNNTMPRIRGAMSLDWDYGAWSVTGRANYIHSYDQMLLPSTFTTPQDPRFQNTVYPKTIPSYSTYDLYARYQINKNLSVSGSILNIADRLPPYDPGFDPTGLYDFSVYDVRGRQFRLNLNYKM